MPQQADRRPAKGEKAPVSREAVEWGFRLLAGRPPITASEFDSFLALPDLDAMRRAFTNTATFHQFFDAVLTGVPTYRMPLFLLRSSKSQALDWRFQPPDLEIPGSQLSTASQFTDPAFLEIIGAMGLNPRPSRVQWEQAWIVSMLATAGLVAPGKRGLGIEPDRERIAALLASRGAETLAIGGDPGAAAEGGTRRMRLFYPEIVHLEDFDRLVGFTVFEPQALHTLTSDAFDFCWSLGMPSRLRSIESTLAFIEASLVPLRPGGLALHTLSFNLSSDTVTWELPDLVILRRQDIETLAGRLDAAGHRILAFNTHPGIDPADEKVTSEVGRTLAHRQRHGVVVSAAFGLAVRKAG